MTEFTVNVIINQPTDMIHQALMNPDNFVYWTTHLERFETIKRKPGEVGSIAHLHYLEKGRSYIMKDTLLFCEPGKRYVSEVSGDVLTATVETTLKSNDGNTTMSIHWSGKGKIVLLKILLPLLKRKIIKQARNELLTFKNLIETRGSDFSIQDSV